VASNSKNFQNILSASKQGKLNAASPAIFSHSAPLAQNTLEPGWGNYFFFSASRKVVLKFREQGGEHLARRKSIAFQI
jgi:hypothetical protein